MAVNASQHLDQNLAEFEKILNTCGKIPVVSTISAVVRFMFGKLEVIASLAASAIKFIAAQFAPDADRKALLEAEAAIALSYAKHGFANMLRALFEVVPIINLAMIGYDHFASRMVYLHEGIQLQD